MSPPNAVRYCNAPTLMDRSGKIILRRCRKKISLLKTTCWWHVGVSGRGIGVRRA